MSALPTPAKRRQFGHQKRIVDKLEVANDEDDEEEEDEKNCQQESSSRVQQQVMFAKTMSKTRREEEKPQLGSVLSMDRSNSVNAKIGLFERLSHVVDKHQFQIVHDNNIDDDEKEKICDNLRNENENDDEDKQQDDEVNSIECDDQLLYEIDEIDDDDDDEQGDNFLPLDTIVEEEDEELPSEHDDDHDDDTGRSTQANGGDNNKISCDKRDNTSARNVLQQQQQATTSNASATNQDKNNNRNVVVGGGGGGFAHSSGANELHSCSGEEIKSKMHANAQPPAELTTDKRDNKRNANSISPQPPPELQIESKAPMALKNNIHSSNGAAAADDDDDNEQRRRPTSENALGAKSENFIANTDERIAIANNKQQQQQQVNNMQQHKQQDKGGSKMAHTQHQQQQVQAASSLLPSTNRLISEHQARQQQALFRALAERQKLLDELAPDERSRQADLMSALNASTWRRSLRRPLREQSDAAVDDDDDDDSQAARASRRRPRLVHSRRRSSSAARAADSARNNGGGGGVPLSSVDLSSMSDRMLDELLGHIASASSSSSSSASASGSLNTSDMSTSSSSSCEESRLSSSSCDDDDDGDKAEQRRRRRRLKRADEVASRLLAPSVIGVHEEGADASDNARQHTNRGAKLKCREAFKKSRRNQRNKSDDDDCGGGNKDNQNDLLVCGGGGTSASHTNGGVPNAQRSMSPATSSNTADSQRNSISLSVSARSHSFGADRSQRRSPTNSPASELNSMTSSSQQQQQHQSVEAILGRMLEALNEAGAQEEQEQLNDLLERGFLHLETLLNCSLTSGSGVAHSPSLLNHQRQLLPLAQHDSPGASSTQSEPSEHQHERSQQHRTQISSLTGHAVQQHSSCQQQQQLKVANQTGATISSDYGSDTQSADCLSSGANMASEQQQQQLATSASVLSPHAIELSFKLAESLRRLAQQQQQQQQQRNAANKWPAQHEAACAAAAAAAADRSDSDEASLLLVRAEQTCAPAPSASPTKARMKSVVLLNSSSASACSSRPQSAASTSLVACNNGVSQQQQQQRVNNNAAGNMTPADGATTPSSSSYAVDLLSSSSMTNQTRDSPSGQRHQPFKTRVNIVNSTTPDSNAPLGVASDLRVHERNVLTINQSPVWQQQQNDQESCQVVKISSTKQQQQQQVSAATSVVPIERRRASRSSLRRRPSFSGSIGSTSREPGAPRAGSPVPRSALAELQQQQQRVALFSNCDDDESKQHQDTSNEHQKGGGPKNKINTKKVLTRQTEMSAECGQVAVDGAPPTSATRQQQQQRQLQRALILAQKYNYSPAKLATSKLSAKLQLKELSSANKQQVKFDGDLQTTDAPTVRLTSGSEQVSAAGVSQVSGKVQVDISYFAKSGWLTVHLLQCANLAPVSKRNTTSNPYVKLYLLPERGKGGKRKSSVRQHELSPRFDERFTFGPLQLSDFEQRIMWLSVWHKDTGLRRNTLLGELLLPLCEVRAQLLTSDLCQSTGARWYPLIGTRASSGELPPPPEVPPNSVVQVARGQQADEQLTTKHVLKSTGHLSMTLARPTTNRSGVVVVQRTQQQAAESVARKLSEFEQKAARLAAQCSNNSLPTMRVASDELTALVAPSGQQRVDSVNNNHKMAPPQVMQVTRCTSGSTLLAANAVAPSSLPAGQLFVALKFVPENVDGSELFVAPARRTRDQINGSLHVLIKEAHNLRTTSSQTTTSLGHDTTKLPPPPSPYCKCYLLNSSGNRISKQKTNLVKRSNSPQWNYECIFTSTSLTRLQAQAIEIHLFSKDSILKNRRQANGDFLGAIRLCKQLCDNQTNNNNNNESHQVDCSRTTTTTTSSYSTLTPNTVDEHNLKNTVQNTTGTDDDICNEREARLWKQMLARPNIWVYGELPLRVLEPLVATTTPPTTTTTTTLTQTQTLKVAHADVTTNANVNNAICAQ